MSQHMGIFRGSCRGSASTRMFYCYKSLKKPKNVEKNTAEFNAKPPKC